jgi:hypothetical protein
LEKEQICLVIPKGEALTENINMQTREKSSKSEKRPKTRNFQKIPKNLFRQYFFEQFSFFSPFNPNFEILQQKNWNWKNFKISGLTKKIIFLKIEFLENSSKILKRLFAMNLKHK